MRQSLIAAGMFLLTGGMVGCGTSSTQEKEDLIVVDVSKDYPKKELILQDLFDVEYIPLETTDEFVTLGWLQAIGKGRGTRSMPQRMASIWTMRKENCLLVICGKER